MQQNETKTKFRRSTLLGLGAALALAGSFADRPGQAAMAGTVEPGRLQEITQGSLVSLDIDGKPAAECPLKHTDVNAEISGFLARVTVMQEFLNNLPGKIEAVYVFPLPQRAAVDDMTMIIGDRTVKGKIKRREEAHAIYEQAKARGHLASLLDQERPNIFVQSVANIPAGAAVKVVISYVETLKYEEGAYEFSFPMVVGPRYIPGSPVGRSGGGWAPDTDQVPDASRITPPVARPGTRAGHDISLRVSLDAGVPVDRIASKTHEVDVQRRGRSGAEIRLRQKAVLPNKDFVLHYDVAGARMEDAVLAHHGTRGGFFTLILQPPERVTAEDVTPKELVFVLDTSGSMSGFPIEKAKEVIALALNGLYPRDTFNVITFAGDTHLFFPEPVPATTENINKAQEFLKSRRGGGGTEMLKAIRAALEPSDSQEHVRIVCFLTDGFVGNDMAIIGEIQKHPNARVFSFGIGSSVNRFLLDKMAEAGRGEVEYVGLNDDSSAAARRFHERVRNPLLTDITIDWQGLPVTEVYPRRIPDLFSAKPVVISGRYTQPARGSIRLRGKMSGRETVRTVPIVFPADAPEHDVLAALWARHKVDDLMSGDWSGIQRGNVRPEIREAITQLGLAYRLMTQFTSFVAVEETIVTEGGVPRRIEVPVEMPEGVSYEGLFGGEAREPAVGKLAARPMAQYAALPPQSVAAPGAGGRHARDAATAEPERREPARAGAKLHPDLAALAAGRAVAGLRTIDGTVEVEIWLAEATPEALAELKKLGFEPTAPARITKVVIGRISVERLREAARLSAVRYITPYRGR